jgi:hypothetical protein
MTVKESYEEGWVKRENEPAELGVKTIRGGAIFRAFIVTNRTIIRTTK